MSCDKLLRPKAAADRLGLGVRTFYREISLGNIPKGIPITARAVGWRESVIEQVIVDRERGIRSSTGAASEKQRHGRVRKVPIADAEMGDNPSASEKPVHT